MKDFILRVPYDEVHWHNLMAMKAVFELIVDLVESPEQIDAEELARLNNQMPGIFAKPKDKAMMTDSNGSLTRHHVVIRYWADLEKSYRDLIREQLEEQNLSDKDIELAIKGFELEVLKFLMDQVHLYYIEKGQNGDRLWTEKFAGSRGNFQELHETLAHALLKNGFYKHNGKFVYPLIDKFVEFAKKGSGKKKKKEPAITAKLPSPAGLETSTENVPRFKGAISNEIALPFMQNTINTVLDKFRKGEIQWPELGLSKTKQFLLEQNSSFTPHVLVGVLSSVATAVALPVATHLGVSEGVIPISSKS